MLYMCSTRLGDISQPSVRLVAHPLRPAPPVQASAYGAVLDVLVDNASRGLLWLWALGAWGLGPVMLESTVFAFTHKVRPPGVMGPHTSWRQPASVLLHCLQARYRHPPC